MEDFEYEKWQIYGIIEASDDRSDYEEDERHWLVFDKVENLLVEGGGTIDGNGNIWWQNSCKVDKDLVSYFSLLLLLLLAVHEEN